MGGSLLDSLNTVSTVLAVLGVLLLVGAVIGSIPLTTVVPVPGRRQRFAVGTLGVLLIITSLAAPAVDEAVGADPTPTPEQSLLGDADDDDSIPTETPTETLTEEAPTAGEQVTATATYTATATSAPPPVDEPTATPTATEIPPADLSSMLPTLTQQLSAYHVEAEKTWNANSLAAQRPDPKAFQERLELWGFRQGASVDFQINDDVADYSGSIIQVSVGVSEFYDFDGAIASARYTFEQEMNWIFEQAAFTIDRMDATQYPAGPAFEVTGFGTNNQSLRVAYVLVVDDKFLYTFSCVAVDVQDVIGLMSEWTNLAAWN